MGGGPTPRARDFLQTSLLLLLMLPAAAVNCNCCCCCCCCCCHHQLLLLLPPAAVVAAAAAASYHHSLFPLVTGSVSFKVTASRELAFNFKHRHPEPGSNPQFKKRKNDPRKKMSIFTAEPHGDVRAHTATVL